MQITALALACLAFTSSGRRVQSEHQSSLGDADPMAALSSILLASDPALGFQVGHGRNIGRQVAYHKKEMNVEAPRCCIANIQMGLSVGDTFPESAAKTCGISGKKSVVFFFGADDAPSCSKQITAFDASLSDFQKAGFTVVGVRNEAGVKESTDATVKLVVDEGDAMRNEIDIAKDLFGVLGGRETYVLDSKGTVLSVHNNQFDPESHIKVALEAVNNAPEEEKSSGGFKLPFR